MMEMKILVRLVRNSIHSNKMAHALKFNALRAVCSALQKILALTVLLGSSWVQHLQLVSLMMITPQFVLKSKTVCTVTTMKKTNFNAWYAVSDSNHLKIIQVAFLKCVIFGVVKFVQTHLSQWKCKHNPRGWPNKSVFSVNKAISETPTFNASHTLLSPKKLTAKTSITVSTVRTTSPVLFVLKGGKKWMESVQRTFTVE